MTPQMDFKHFTTLYEYGVRYMNPFAYSLSPRGQYLWQYLGDIAPGCLQHLGAFRGVRYDRSLEPKLLSHLEAHWDSAVLPYMVP